MGQRQIPIEQVYLAYTVPDGECRIWQRSKANGYGRLSHHGVEQLAHRVFYNVFIGPIPTGHELHHICGRRACVNPAHLEPLTRLAHTNKTPRHFKFRTHCPEGHAYTTENTILRWTFDRKGKRYLGRVCRTCANQKDREYYRRKSAARGRHPRVPPPACPKGHLFTPENTIQQRYYREKGGRKNGGKPYFSRHCRLCRRAHAIARQKGRLGLLPTA